MSSASRPTPGLLLPARATDTGLGVLACERGGGRSQEGLGPGRLLRLDLVLVRAGRALPTSGAQGRQHAPASLPCRQLSPFLLGSGWQGRLSTWSGGWRKKPVPLARPWASQLAGKTLGSEGGQRELSSRAPRYVQTQKNEYFSAHVFSLPHSIWQEVYRAWCVLSHQIARAWSGCRPRVRSQPERLSLAKDGTM